MIGRTPNKRLQDDVFCLTEERNYFQSKYLEQISELAALRGELNKAKREVQKLREEVMTNSVASLSIKDEHKEEDASTLTGLTREEYLEGQAVNISISSTNLIPPPRTKQEPEEEEEKKEEEPEEELEQVFGSGGKDEIDKDEDSEVDEKAQLRLNAEKLLQWADYRSSRRSSISSVASPSSSTARSSVGVPRTIQSTSLKEDVEEEMSMQD